MSAGSPSRVDNNGRAATSTATGRQDAANLARRLAWQSEFVDEDSRPGSPGNGHLELPSGAQTPQTPLPRSASVWALEHLEQLLSMKQASRDTYGLTELRDGFFDAVYLMPPALPREQLLKEAEGTAFRKVDPLSVKRFLPRQWHVLNSSVKRVLFTRSGVKLIKSFSAVFAAYVLCLVPVIRNWLGPYNYVMVVSAVLNHPGRSVGSQIDGAFLTTLGMATGLGWGSFGLWLSNVSELAQVGHGGILAMFLFIYFFIVAALRAWFIRSYQSVLAAGIAVSYMCLADVSGDGLAWRKITDFAIPWALGQAIALCVCCTVFPDAGSRALAVTLDNAFATMLDGVDNHKGFQLATRQRLARTFTNLTLAYRDLAIDISVSKFNPEDVRELRNVLQRVVRALLAFDIDIKTAEIDLGDALLAPEPSRSAAVPETGFTWLRQSDEGHAPSPKGEGSDEDLIVRAVRQRLRDPTRRLLHRMREGLQGCHAALMDISGYRKYLGPDSSISSDLGGYLDSIKQATLNFDKAESEVVGWSEIHQVSSPRVVEIFAYCRPIRQAANPIEATLVKVAEMVQRQPKWPKLYWPSYPLMKSLDQTNAQVRHDRGGVTAGSYYKTFSGISGSLKAITYSEHNPLPQVPDMFHSTTDDHVSEYAKLDDARSDRPELKKSTVRYNVWKVAHRLQGFETRFALKVTLVTSLLAIPAWINQSRSWWNQYHAWWAVAIAWIVMHPRVGGNLQDLVIRSGMAFIGAIWSAAAFAAGNGSPYVMGVFAAIYLAPVLYRFTQSSHARSGLIGSISFSVTSLVLMSTQDEMLPITTSLGLGVAFIVGVVSAIIINWVLWPFVARHELRKASSGMLFFMSVVYRSIIGKYIYYDLGHQPTPEDVERSEVLEARLREGFVRLRQLTNLTQHEPRLRAPFDPLPYWALIASCERFFEYLVAVRQAALFFHPKFINENSEAAERLLSYRRDAVASVITNLYILAGALRGNRKVPRFLPSALAARKHLTDMMVRMEAEFEDDPEQPELGEKKRWAQIYNYSYNTGLTGCVTQLEELEKYTKLIVGEQGFDDEWDNDHGGDSS